MRFDRIAMAVVGVGLMAAGQAVRADTISWATWGNAVNGATTGSAVGAIPSTPGVTATYTGEVESVMANYPSWTPTGTYIGGIVDNAPPASGGIVQLFGATGSTNTITFSSPVVNPVLAIWSLGQGQSNTRFVFDQSEPFTIVAGGASNEYSGSGLTSSGSTIFGSEGNGSVVFNGTFSSISWTNPDFENWYGFTVGVAGVTTGNGPAVVPLPATLPMAGLSMLGLAAWRTMKVRRQNRKQV